MKLKWWKDILDGGWKIKRVRGDLVNYGYSHSVVVFSQRRVCENYHIVVVGGGCVAVF